MFKNCFILFLIGWAGFGQHQDKVDFARAEVLISPFPDSKSISGSVRYEFNVLANVDSIFIDAKNMNFTWIKLDGKTIQYNYDGNKVSIQYPFRKGNNHSVQLKYVCKPKQTVYFLGWGDEMKGNEQIWTQGQGKYTSHWLPSFDDMKEKVEFDLSITVAKDFQVITNGKALDKVGKGDLATWRFDMQKPMSSYLLAFVIGDYRKQKNLSKSGIPIENYFYPKDSLKVEPTYRYTKEIFDFLEEEIGVPYPWENYKQIPVHDFLYAGMENTSATIFSDGYVIDSTAFVDKNYVNVNAHELAHQWFGNLVTEKDGNHHWLHEGFATYYAYLAEKKIFGNDHCYWKLYESALQLKSEADKGNGQSLLDPKASSLTFYEKGALALFMLQDLIGEENFKNGIKNYLEKHQFKNVTISDFLIEMERSSGVDLSSYKKEWLENTELPFDELKSVLKKSSESLRTLFEMEDEFQRIQSDDLDYASYWNKTNSTYLKKYVIEKYHEILPRGIINSAFTSDTLQIRQALAVTINSVPETLKQQFESLLEDKSYVTLENALLKLWVAFPKDRANYLSKTKDIIGLPNKNLRLLWLTLAIVTNEYDAKDTQNYFQELSSYTSPEYSWEIRIGAFGYLMEAIGFNDEALLSLIQACGHHSWQFKKYARNLLDELLKDADYVSRIQELAQELKGEDLRYIQTKLKK